MASKSICKRTSLQPFHSFSRVKDSFLNFSTKSLRSFSSCSASSCAQNKQSENAKFVLDLVASRKPMFSLPKPFYTEEMYKIDLDYVWRQSWLMAGFEYEIPKPGDYFVYKVDADETIIIRGDDGVIRAFVNSCRHRGSRLCRDTNGHVAKNIVCPYHQWSFNTKGELVYARDMQPSFLKSQYGLHPVHVKEVEGLIFICLSPDKPRYDFEPARKVIQSQLHVHGLKDAKSAHTIRYNVNANWKVVYENNRECYHCNVRHPEYIKSNYDTAFSYFYRDGQCIREPDPRYGRAEDIDAYIQEKTEQWKKEFGFECTADNTFPGDGWYRATRMPMRKGWLVESLDGKPVSRLMGKFTSFDMGSMRIHTLPNFWVHCSSDHCVAARLTPTSPWTTEVKADWIVHKDAVEGKDYDLKKMLPFWDLTSIQDWDLCQENQKGINSSRYEPGPFSELKEPGLERYTLWYLSLLADSAKRRL